MGFKIPQPIKMLPGGAGLQNLPSLAFLMPQEGRRYIPVEIDWDGNGTTYEINVQGITTQPFSQIVMLDVDNTQSGAPVTFYFPDSTDTLVVSGGEGGLFPAFTNGTIIYAAAPAALSTDITRIRVLNYRQEPIANPPPEFSDVATALGLTAGGTYALLPAGTSGTLEGYSVNVGLAAGAGSAVWTVTLKDHATGTVLDQSTTAVGVNLIFSGIVLSVSGAAIRFSSGLDLVLAQSGTAFNSANTNASIRYRTP